MYDLAIVGGGPAGAAAGVYAARKKLKTVFVTKEFGGQSTDSPSIENWIGTISISGDEFAKTLREHVEAYAGDSLEIKEGSGAQNIQKTDDGFSVTTESGEEYTARAVLVCSGAHRRKLDVPGADTFEHKGITYCASCDGPMFTDQDVAVIGGGNAGFESAAQLLAYAKSVTLLHRREEFKADPITVEKVLKDPNMTVIRNADTKEIKGETMADTLIYTDRETGEEHELKVTGIFVEIGLIPTTGFVADLVELNKEKQIVVDCMNQRTSVDGVWAAGDCTNAPYHQNNIAAGDAVKALEDIYMELKRRS